MGEKLFRSFSVLRPKEGAAAWRPATETFGTMPWPGGALCERQPWGMPRIEPSDAEQSPEIQAELQRQTDRYGSPLFNHLVLARVPELFHGFRAMWDGLDRSGLIPPRLLSL